MGLLLEKCRGLSIVYKLRVGWWRDCTHPPGVSQTGLGDQKKSGLGDLQIAEDDAGLTLAQE